MERKVIDLCLDLPPEKEYITGVLKSYYLDLAYANFKTLYAPLTLKEIGASPEEAETALREGGEEGFVRFITEKADENVPTMDEFVKYLDELGVEWGMISSADGDNEKTAALVRKYPDKFKGFVSMRKADAMTMVRDLEHGVRDLGLSAFYITPFRLGMSADDPTLYPVYAKAVELDVPVHFHCSMSSGTDVPYDIAHPRHIDRVAMDFPELRVMASVGGWPWVNEFLTLPIRHKNLCVNLETHQPKDIVTPGSGMEPFAHYGELILQDKLTFASNWTALSLTLDEVIRQAEELPFSGEMKRKMLYENAKRFYRA